MQYADVILPLAIDGCFTYSIPQDMESKAASGIRVLVPVGKKKYVGVLLRTHDEKPKFKCREILSILDSRPVVTDLQLRLWMWMAEYYMSSLGDVYAAALPGGMKTIDNYKPKTETCIALADEYRGQKELQIALNILSRAKKQYDTFCTFLRLSHWDSIADEAEGARLEEVTREELMNASHCSSSVLKQLTDRRLLVAYEREVGRLNNPTPPDLDKVKKLNAAQTEAYNNILFSFMKKNVVLLHGVTSSGKTEIYIHLIKQAIEKRQQVLFLMPEIALTVQMRERLQRVFGNRLGIYHSKYSDAERVEIWQKQLSACPYDVILGARSAVLLPFQNLGLVIVDEEHETSFKQQDPAPRYHARNVAIMLAKMCGAKTLLGTATPAAESYNNARTGKFGLVELKQRYKDIQLPEIQVVDIKDLQRRKMMNGPFSPQLLSSIRQALERGEQSIIFQNRRGFVSMIECRACGWVPHCANCDVSLTYHKNLERMTCHYCGAVYEIPKECPCCGGSDLRGKGYGTEKIEDRIMEIFPDAKVARMDLDTTRTRNAYERIISDFSAGRTNILIGTQMISKGLDFDRVRVVGILNADSMLNYPDFRAYEHAYMMMSQVSGRAGRKGERGLVILQTKSPQLPVINQVVHNDYENFFRDMMEERLAFRYPPFHHLVYAYLKHSREDIVEMAAACYGECLRQVFGDRVLGPDKPAVAKVKTMNIRKIVIKFENAIDMQKARGYLRAACSEILAMPGNASLQIYYDVDPL